MKKYFKENLGLFIKGLIIGGAVIIPGISGGTMAILLGVYDRIISSITDIRKNFRKSFLYLLPLVLGILVSFIILVFPLGWAFAHIPFPIICLFGGLIFGGTAPLIKEIKGPRHASNIIILIAGFLFAASLGIISIYFDFDSSAVVQNFSFTHALIMIAVGFLVISTQLVPGISATLLLLVLGFYQAIIDVMKTVLSSVTGGGLSSQGGNIATLSMLIIGAVLGFFLFSHLVKYLLTRHHKGFYHGVVGFVFGSIISLFYNVDIIEIYSSIAPWQLILGIVLVFGGAVAGIYLTKFSEKIEKRNNNRHELGT